MGGIVRTTEVNVKVNVQWFVPSSDGIREMRERSEAMDPSVVRVYDESIPLSPGLAFASQPVVLRRISISNLEYLSLPLLLRAFAEEPGSQKPLNQMP